MNPDEPRSAQMNPGEEGGPQPLPTMRATVELIAGYHSPQLDVAVRLNTNEAPEPPPAAFVERLGSALAELPWNRYPDRRATDLCRAIADLEGVSPDRVFVANGSNEVLQSILLAYGGHGRTAVTFEPTYAMHGHIARLVDTEVVEIDRDGAFDIARDTAAPLVVAADPDVIFVCSPNNPTGVTADRATVEWALELARSCSALLVVDEAYGQFSPWSAVELVDDSVPLVVTRTYSKTWSMAAARLGYAIGPAWAVEGFWKVALPYHLSALSQAAGLVALGFREEMHERVAHLVEERGRVAEALAELDVDQWPSGANFVLFRPRGIDGDAVWQGLVDRSVLVRNCAGWPRLEGCLRVTIGTPEENDAFLVALREVVGGAGGAADGRINR